MKNALIGKGIATKVDELVPAVEQLPTGQSVGVMRGSPDNGTLRGAVECLNKYSNEKPVGASAGARKMSLNGGGSY